MSKQVHLADRKLKWSPLNRTPGIPARGGLLDWSEHPKSVCIYGAGYGKEHAPLDDPDWTVWAINLVPPLDKEGRVRADAWFDIHQKVAQTEDDLRWIANCPVPIYVAEDLKDHGPNCIEFPFVQLDEVFGMDYFTCTFAYQIALAIVSGFTEIGLFGVELRYGSERERTVEWACTSFWMGYAAASGINIVVPEGSWLGRHPALYGLEYEAEINAVNQYLKDVTLFGEGLGG